MSGRTMRSALAWLATLCGLALGVSAQAANVKQPGPDKLALTQVRDLHYGDTLFYFYAGDSFEALTRLLAYTDWGRVPHHEAEAQLLLGGLYLELGLHNEAGERFEKLLQPSVPVGVRNRAWFYLAKIWYVRGYDARAEQAVRRLEGVLPPELESERVHLLANVLMRQQRFAEAAELLDGWQGPQDWTAFARFNLGVALIRDNQLDVAARYLGAVGQMQTRSSELLALRDRANLALGFAYLQAGEAANARPYLQRVRLDGTYSNRALLGAGWAEAELGEYRAALTPWLELKGRNLLDPAVQESLLAVPYAFAKLDAPAQASEYYEAAIQAFGEKSARLDAAIERVRSGGLLDAMLAREAASGGYGWFWRLRGHPEAPESRLPLLAARQPRLPGRPEELPRHRLPRPHASALGGQLRCLPQHDRHARGGFRGTACRAPTRCSPRRGRGAGRAPQCDRARLDEIGSRGDVAALGSAEQRDQWQRIVRVEEALAAAARAPMPRRCASACGWSRGALYWRLAADYRGSMFTQRRALRDTDAVCCARRRTAGSVSVGRARACREHRRVRCARRCCARAPRGTAHAPRGGAPAPERGARAAGDHRADHAEGAPRRLRGAGPLLAGRDLRSGGRAEAQPGCREPRTDGRRATPPRTGAGRRHGSRGRARRGRACGIAGSGAARGSGSGAGCAARGSADGPAGTTPPAGGTP
ncbi:MAG: tetratricopeptide repeat protein [Steroidobacteraceae bacterium]